jgi:predicted GNAT superfamily acetyltransferase
MDDVSIRDAVGRELVDGSALLARSLGFTERDALPPWFIHTAVGCGGVALAAFRSEQLVGFSFAVPSDDGSLFSCGLAVDPSCRGQGLGRRLKLAQRDRALQQDRTHIRWTADPLSARALRLYLAGLGAHLTAYAAELYAAVRPSTVPPDDVIIDWPLRDAARLEPVPAVSIEVPFDHRALPTPELLDWRMRVRHAMTQALDGGAIGTAVRIDRSAHRAWVLFA